MSTRSVTCPKCGAEPGTGCTTVNGFAMSVEHVSRLVHSALTESRTILCANFGQPVQDDARSPTGLSHLSTGRARCDGQPTRSHMHNTYEMASTT